MTLPIRKARMKRAKSHFGFLLHRMRSKTLDYGSPTLWAYDGLGDDKVTPKAIFTHSINPLNWKTDGMPRTEAYFSEALSDAE